VSSLLSDLGGFINRVGQLFDAVSVEENISNQQKKSTNYETQENMINQPEDEMSLVPLKNEHQNQITINVKTTNNNNNNKERSSNIQIFNGVILKHEKQEISFQNVDVYSPFGTKLISSLTFNVNKNQSLLIMGEPGR
jgi:ABC-type uncharacterized transport system fused permease/ATPase subunit